MNLDYFVGKICTILTSPVNIQFKDFVQHAQYFTGEVVSLSPAGVWIKHPQSKVLAFYATQSIIGIVEEQTVSEDDPLMDKIKEDIQKKKEAQRPKMPGQTLIPVDDLTKMLKKKS